MGDKKVIHGNTFGFSHGNGHGVPSLCPGLPGSMPGGGVHPGRTAQKHSKAGRAAPKASPPPSLDVYIREAGGALAYARPWHL